MIPKLYESTEMDFKSNGLGSLPDAISCKVTEERNGCYELEMEYPVGGLHYDLIENNRIIYAKPNETSDPQPFDIKEITPSMDKMTAKVYAQHVRYRMNGIPVSPFNAQGINDALAGLKQNSLIKHPFTFYTDIINTSSKFNVGLPGTLGSLLGGTKGSILDTFSGSAGCEYEFDKFSVKLHAHRGTDSGVSIRYAKNLTGCKMESSIESVYTGVLAYWQKKGEDKEELLSSDIQYIANHTSYPREYIYMLDCSSDFEDTPTVEQLNAKASDYAVNNRIGEPSVSVDVSFIPLWGTEEYKAIAPLERVNLCGTVTVCFDLLGVNVKAIVNKTVYDVLSEKYESISIGSAKSKLGETIKQEAHDQAEAVKKDTISAVQGSIDKAVDKIRGGTDGHVILSTNANGETNEVYAYDGNSLETAAKVLRLNYEGLAGTDKGINGRYNVAITTDGHVNASMVTFGEMNGNLIKANSVVIGALDEEVTGKINSAQSSADKANSNANNAQNSANNALDAANKADAKADQAKSDAAAASSAAQKAKDQADEAQRKSNTANDIANGAVATISPIAQVVIVDDKGLKILNSENNTSYAQMQSTGLFVFVNNEQRAVFGATSKVENMAIQDYLMFGSHRAETKIEDGEEGTAFFHIGDVK
jgi:phage minor structural protein|nr:MAG TPA_asm: tail protein [Caudoviricetes sp.]